MYETQHEKDHFQTSISLMNRFESVLAIITETETMYLYWKESEESYNCIQADEENGISEVIPIKSEIVTSKDILLLSKQDEQYNVGYESNFDATVKKI